jgi:Flp pilus assembly protein TadB
MPQICHAHCPSGSSGGLVVAVVAIGAGAVAAIGAYIGDILLTAGIVVTLLVIAGTWLLVHLLRRDRRETTGRPMVRSLADVQQGQLSAPAPVRQAITGVHVITDARELPETARITIKRDGATTG